MSAIICYPYLTPPFRWKCRLEMPDRDIRKLLIPEYMKLVLIVDYHRSGNYVRSFPYKKYIYLKFSLIYRTFVHDG